MPVTLNIIESTTELGLEVVEVVLASASEPGPAGPGVPTGGTDGQVLTKTSATDYATAWEDPTGGGGGAPDDVDYLVGTASGDLSAEIVVGTSPGGELGGTWASPTVDTTHSGSSHAAVQAAAEATAAAALSSHESDQTNVHGIADTTALALTANHPSNATFNDHSARHENGGADEISLAGLSGTSEALQAHLDDTADAHDASAISFVPAGSIASTTVQAAIEEVASEASSASGEALERSISQTGHGFSVGEVVIFTGGEFALAQANSAANSEVVGIVSEVTDVNTFVLHYGGRITGLSGLSADSVYFLDDDTPGLLTTTEPADAGDISKPLLVADSTTSGYFFNYRGAVVVDVATQAELNAHLTDSSDAHDASAISVLDTNGDYTATDVEGVLAEIAPQLGAGGVPDLHYESRSSNTILGVADKGKTIDITAAITQTFEADETLGDGWWVILRNATDNGTTLVVLNPAGTETIDGLSTVTLYSGESRLILCNGSGANFNSILLHGGFARFTADGNFIVPHGLSIATVECIGGGGGGGGGRGGANNSVRQGGTGGGGGSRYRVDLLADVLGAAGDAIAVDVATGGGGGGGGSSGNGTGGTVGGNTTFGSLVTGYGGGGGFGGTGTSTNTNSGGGGGGGAAGQAGQSAAGSIGGGNSVIGAAGMGNAGGGSTPTNTDPLGKGAELGGGGGGGANGNGSGSGGGGGSSTSGPGGGGGGAGLPTGNGESAGSAGGVSGSFGSGSVGGGGAADGGNGAPGDPGDLLVCGDGGAGGGSQASGTGGHGGDGGAPGGGGGGGGGGTTTGGDGGDGAAGECRVWYS